MFGDFEFWFFQVFSAILCNQDFRPAFTWGSINESNVHEPEGRAPMLPGRARHDLEPPTVRKMQNPPTATNTPNITGRPGMDPIIPPSQEPNSRPFQPRKPNITQSKAKTSRPHGCFTSSCTTTQVSTDRTRALRFESCDVLWLKRLGQVSQLVYRVVLLTSFTSLNS